MGRELEFWNIAQATGHKQGVDISTWPRHTSQLDRDPEQARCALLTRKVPLTLFEPEDCAKGERYSGREGGDEDEPDRNHPQVEQLLGREREGNLAKKQRRSEQRHIDPVQHLRIEPRSGCASRQRGERREASGVGCAIDGHQPRRWLIISAERDLLFD